MQQVLSSPFKRGGDVLELTGRSHYLTFLNGVYREVERAHRGNPVYKLMCVILSPPPPRVLKKISIAIVFVAYHHLCMRFDAGLNDSCIFDVRVMCACVMCTMCVQGADQCSENTPARGVCVPVYGH